MNRQTVRDILCDWGATKQRVRLLLSVLASDMLICDAVAGLNGRVMDDMPHGTGITDPTQRAAAELVKMHEAFAERAEGIRGQINTLLRDEWMVDCLLDELPDNRRDVIVYKYRGRKKYHEIAREMGCTFENAKKIERAAVESLINMIK